MKVKIVTIAIGLSLAISAARGNQILNITEVGENLFATFNGAPASFVTITPVSADEWDIVFSSGFTIDTDIIPELPQFIEVGEPESPFGEFENLIFSSFINGTTGIHWSSEHQTGIPSSPPLVDVEPNALIGPSGERFDIRFADVRETSSTISIFGIGLAGLAWFARFRRTAM